MDPILILSAFILGFAASQVGLPPLVGYLIAGFALNAMNIEGGAILEDVSDLGVLLLLFTIGLKLRLRSLLRPEIWAGAAIHMLITVIVFGAGLYALSNAGIAFFAGISPAVALLLACALSFSSTVFAVKVLEERGEMASLHGRVAIGILIMQDIFAVVFLTLSAGKSPSAWALSLPLYLAIIRPVLLRVMDRCGHGELLILYGLFLALVAGAAAFEIVGMKPDLGALVLGILVAQHPKASEMAKALFGLKDLFLVGFFLSIGLSGAPTIDALAIAALLVVAVPFKVALFFLLLTRFRLRVRTSLLGSLSLANYSEFGLIVGSIGAANGWISGEWLIVIAVALSATFVLASPLNSAAHSLYIRWHDRLLPFETKARHPDDLPLDPGSATVAVFGMGRIGTAAYDFMRQKYGETVIGIDFDAKTVGEHREAGRNVVLGDATDSDFWERVRPGGARKLRLILLSMPRHAANLYAAKQILQSDYVGQITAIAQFDDEVNELRELGVHAAYNFYAEAGTGFAEHAFEFVEARDRFEKDRS